MVAGGYRSDGAWMASVEFLDYDRGEWIPLIHFPRMQDGRHYHGLASIGLVPYVFGGWNNGSLNSVEYLSSCDTSMDWIVGKLELIAKREKFAFTAVPPSFISACP